MPWVLAGLFALGLLGACSGGKVGGQSGSEGCTKTDDDIFRSLAADAGVDGGADIELLDDDAGVIETAFNDPKQCVEP